MLIPQLGYEARCAKLQRSNQKANLFKGHEEQDKAQWIQKPRRIPERRSIDALKHLDL